MTIKLANDAKEKVGIFSGVYEISADVNGKPSYRLGGKAIWYNVDRKQWFFGAIDDVGSYTGYIFAVDNFGELTDLRNVWKYWNGNEWKIAGYDIIVEYDNTSGTSQFLLNSFTFKNY